MLMIAPVHLPSLFSMMRYSASTPSLMSTKQRFCSPPSISWIGAPCTRFRISWVIARELPMRALVRLSSRGPIQLNGRNSVKSSCPFAP